MGCEYYLQILDMPSEYGFQDPSNISYTVNQLGLVAGPIIGGAFTSYSDWRWCMSSIPLLLPS